MFSKFMALVNKPNLNSAETVISNRTLWENEYISKSMLKSHMNPDEEGATSKHEYVCKVVGNSAHRIQ